MFFNNIFICFFVKNFLPNHPIQSWVCFGKLRKFAATCFKQRRNGQHPVKVFAGHLNCIPTLTIKTFAMIRWHYCYTLQGWAEHSPEMGHWSGAWNWWSKAFYTRLSDQSHSGLVWWGDRIQLRPQQYWSLQVINIIIRAVSIVPCCQDEPRGGSLHPAGLGCHRGARLRLGRSRGQLVRVLFLWYFEFPTPCLGKQKPSGGSSDHTHDNCCLQLCSCWQFGKNADIWKWKWTKWTSFWVNVRERCCLLRLSPRIYLWWWTVCRHQHDTDNNRARFEILSELHILVIQ